MDLKQTESDFKSSLKKLQQVFTELIERETIPKEAKDKIMILLNFINSIQIEFNSPDNSYSFCLINYTIIQNMHKTSFSSINTEQTKFFLRRIHKHVTTKYTELKKPMKVTVLKQEEKPLPNTKKQDKHINIKDEKNTSKEITNVAKKPECITTTFTLSKKDQVNIEKAITSFSKAITSVIAYINIL